MLKDLVNIADEKIYEFDIKNLDVENNLFLRAIKNAKGYMSFYYDSLDELRVEYHLSGIMVCPDAITLEDVNVDFDISDDLKVVNKDNEDGFYLKEDMTIEQMALYLVLPEVPIKVVNSEKIEYSRGDGWSFMSEEDYQSIQDKTVDPRLQKLKDYKFEEDK